MRRRAPFSMVANVLVTANAAAEPIAVKYLRAGSVIAVPTDTVYGLACDATNKTATNNLYAVKNRKENNPLAFCLGEVNDVKTWAYIDHLPQELLHSLLPGPVTLILRYNSYNILDDSFRLGGKVGIRVPDSSFIRNITLGLGKPLALTSANLSNEPSAVEVGRFGGSIWDKLPAVFDGGKLGSNGESTVVDLSQPGRFHLIRKGAACQDLVKTLMEHNLNDIYY